MAQFSVTISNVQVTADLTDYPIYVDLSDMPASFWAAVANGGGDIRVYKDDGTTELAREVVKCDTATELGELHIKYAGTLSSSIDTVIIIDVDGARSDYATTDTYGRNNVWSGHNIVQHLESTGDNSTGGANPSVNTVAYTDGNIGEGATQTDGSARGFDFATSFSITSAPVVHSAWFKSVANFNQDNGGMSLVVYTRPSSPYYSCYLQMIMGSLSGDRGKIRFYLRNTSSVSVLCDSPLQYNDGQWHLARGVYNGSTLKLYVDGVLVQTASASGSLQASGKTTTGTNWDEAAANVWVGEYDEVRSQNSFEVSADYASTEYNNQNSPSTFYSVAELAGGGGQNSNFLMFMN